ncbi:GNAT family N-acetyltransferase [Inquilinus sp. OTU3971]|uniref:GNAT family N-acetyltransferase n=1 Tax=Inquilinus sp. OTU3971 TaxID=3043855 RepID=UPI00313D47B5
MYLLKTERPRDAAEVDTLLDLAFGPNRQTKVSYRYRDGIAPVRGLCFVVREDGRPSGRILGSIRYWPMLVEPGLPTLLLGPLAVRPELRGAGVGAALMRGSMKRAADMGHRMVLLVGDLAYYARFGFQPAAPLGFAMPDEQPHRLLVAELRLGALEDGPGGTLLRADAAVSPAQISVSMRAALC